MGQYWYIVLVDVAQFLSCGKLVEFLFDKEADCLVDLLAVPVKPSLAQLSCATAYPVDEPGIEPLPIKKDLKSPCQIQPHLAAIPDELILMIFHSLDLLSCFRFSLVSKRLWRIGWPFFQQKITEFMSPWAGKRIICLGDECEANDLPAGFLTTEEENIVNEGLDDSEIDPDDGIYQRPGNLLNIAKGRFQEVNSEVKPYEILRRPLPGEPKHGFYSKHSQSWRRPRTMLDEARHLRESERTHAYSFAHGEEEANYYPETESWILRNLNTAEFVQGDALLAAFHSSGRQDGLHLRYPGFGEAIMGRICWSRRAFKAPFNRGVWAGHRLEICTGKVHALHSDIGWKDVTSEIVDELSVALNLPTQKKSKKINDQNR